MGERPIDLEACRVIWGLLRLGKPASIDWLVERSGLRGEQIRRYLDLLIRNGYVALSNLSRSVSGEWICWFLLHKRTGREAPFVAESGQFVDPNLQPAHDPEIGEGPGITARIRVAAERLQAHGDTISVAKLRRLVCGERTAGERAFGRAICRLVSAGEIERIDKQTVAYVGDKWHMRELIRGVLKGQFGWGTMADVAATLGAAKLHQKHFSDALDILRAEGYRIERRGGNWRDGKHQPTEYRITKPEGDCDGGARGGCCGDPGGGAAAPVGS